MHAGNHVIIKKKLAITVMPANKLLHKNYYNSAQKMEKLTNVLNILKQYHKKELIPETIYSGYITDN